VPPTPSYRPVRLVLLLFSVLAVALVTRVLVVAFVNRDRIGTDRLEGIQRIDGRYYPVEKVCLVVDDGELEEGLEGSRLDRGTFSLLANGNSFDVVTGGEDDRVAIGCQWRNWEFDKDPQVIFSFEATVHTGRAGTRNCRTAMPGGTAREVSLGSHSACRESDGFEVSLGVVDDNAEFFCGVKSQDKALLPALEEATRSECEDFIDRLSHSRPITYGGSAFLTVR
jgi:hypothetical protein